MRIVIIAFIVLQLSTLLWADKNFNQYLKVKNIAYELYESGNTNEAILYVNEFINKSPRNIRAQNLLAVLHFWKGNYKKSEYILKNILKKEQFPQSVLLLKKIEKKTKKPSTIKKVVVKKSSQIALTKDLQFVMQNIKNNSLDTKNRKILVYHYDSIGEKKQALRLANEVLKINPDDAQMLRFINRKNTSFATDNTIKKAYKKLDEFYSKQEYSRFLNLYNSLERNSIDIPTQIHINALYSAIELKLYKKARSILYLYRFPQNKYISEIEDLVDEKLLLQRFTSL